MNTPQPLTPSDEPESVADQAALWVLRHDRGLTAVEQDEFSQWLAAAPAHGAAFAEHRMGWDELDRLAGVQSSVHAFPDPDLLAPVLPPVAPRNNVLRFYSLVLAAAAAVVVGFFLLRSPPPAPVPAALFARIEERTLEDGSTVSLNRGAIIAVNYSASERRVRLVQGEAHFAVAKNPARPFIVSAGGVDVRAVGTAFNVRLGTSAVEVLVTEGRVGVEHVAATAVSAANSPSAGPPASDRSTYVSAGESTLVPLISAVAASASPVAALTPIEMDTRLAWQPRLLDFTDTPLAEIVAEFNRRNPVRLVVSDASLAGVRLSASFRSDNVEGFVRLMESDFGMKAETRGGAEVMLRRSGR